MPSEEYIFPHMEREESAAPPTVEQQLIDTSDQRERPAVNC